MNRRTQTARVVLVVAWAALAVAAVLVRNSTTWQPGPNRESSPAHTVVRPDVVLQADVGTDRAQEPVLTAPDTRDATRPASISRDEARAHALRRAGREGEALALYRSALLSGVLSPDGRVQLAWLLAVRHEYTEAWQVAAALDDRARPHLELRARLAAWAGQLHAAATLLPRWLEQAPRDAEAWAQLADVQRRLGIPSWRESLDRFVALRPGDLDARRRVARELAAAGDLGQAITTMNAILREPGHTAGDWVAIGHLHEQRGHLTEAIASYEAAVALDAGDPDLLLRMARVYRWTSRPTDATAAYAKHFVERPDARLALSGEHGLALLEAGRAREALQNFDDALPQDEGDPAIWVGAAQAASALGQPDAVVTYLRGLRRLRSLSDAEGQWLAGQLEAAGHGAEAAAAYREVLASGRVGGGLWERVGDIEAGLGRHLPALEAYDQLLGNGAPASLWLKAARAAAAAGRLQRAVEAYSRSLPEGPDARGVALEAARFLASVQQPERALAAYRHHLDTAPDASGLHLELTRTALAADRPLDALRWASEGLAAGDHSPELLFGQAQALHLAGRPKEAGAVLRTLVARDPRNHVWRTWLAWTAQARGRSLEAYEQLGLALRDQGRDRPDLLLSRGDAAAVGGDPLRARLSYEAALAAGADPRLVAERRLALPAPAQAAAPFEMIRDTNGVELAKAGGQFVVRPGQVARITGSWATGYLMQDGRARFEQRAVELRLDHLMPSPRVVLDGGAGIQQAGGASVPIWRAAAQYRSPGGGRAGLVASRETPWSVATPLTDLRFTRIRRLDDLGARFSSTGTSVTVDLPIADRHSVTSSASFRRYSDTNESRQLYVQYQRELTAGGPVWIALQPHVHVEGWRTVSTAYFSPHQHVTTGLTLRAIADRRDWRIDASVIPDARFNEGRRGMGLTFSGGLTRRVGRGSAGTQLMWFDDRRYGFRAWRLTAEVAIPVAR
jgi:tetratricopeptide (TPR) repeat protein